MRLMSGWRRGIVALGVCGLLALSGPVPALAKHSVITWGKPGEITSYDVHVAGTVASWELFELVYETLLTTDAHLHLQPGLAVSWEQPTPTSYIFHLRPDARFSNGRTVDADDVIGSLRRIMNPETASYWAQQLGPIGKMTALDAHTVRIDLERPHPAFLAALAHISAAIIPIKEMKAGKFDPTKQMLGSGPYMVVGHKQDESWTLARNPYYWRKGYPLADEIRAPVIPDASARVAALRDGRIDYTTFDNPDIPRMLARDHDIKVVAQQTTNYYRLDVNALRAASPFHDRRVREAMNLALDRDAIAAIVFAGTTHPDYPVPAAFGLSACHDLPTYAWPRAKRLEKARALLREAGILHPHVQLIATSANPMLPRIAQVMQQSLGDIGMKVDILQQPMAEYLNRVFTRGDFDMALSWLAGYTDPTMVISWWNPKFALWNATFQQNVPALDTALVQVKQMQPGAARDAKLAEICRMIDDGANLLALVSKVDYVASRSDRVALRIDPVSGSSDTFQHVAEFRPLQ